MPSIINLVSPTAADTNNAIGQIDDGGTINISGTCRWGAKVTIPTTKAITLQGTGLVTIPPVVSNTFTVGRIDSPTIIYDDVATGPMLTVNMKTGTAASPQTGLVTRVTGFSIRGGTRTAMAAHTAGESGTVCFRGHDNRYDSRLIFDNCEWNNVNGECVQNGAVCGVFSKIFMPRGLDISFLYPMQITWYGGNWGDQSFAAPCNWGMTEFGLVIEDSQFEIISGGWCDAMAGARICFRYNQLRGGTGLSSHGSESGSPAGLSGCRGVALVDAYENDFFDVSAPFIRSGVIMFHHNRFYGTSNAGCALLQYRDRWGFAPWGFGDGDDPWDKNFVGPNADGSYFSPTGYTTTGGSNTNTNLVTGTVTVAGTPFTGLTLAGYTIVRTDVTASNSTPLVNTIGIIQSNTANSITFQTGFNSAATSLQFTGAAGERFKIMRIDASWDQPGMHYGNPITRGSSQTPNLSSIGGTAPAGYRNSGGPQGQNDQVVTPCYMWSQSGTSFNQKTDLTIRTGVHFKNNTVPPNVGPDGPDTYQYLTLVHPHPLLAPAGPAINAPYSTTFATDQLTPPPSFQFTASGFSGTPVWTKNTGLWPGGVTLDASGLLHGTPTGGTTDYTVNIKAAYAAAGETAFHDFTLQVQAPNVQPTISITVPGGPFLVGDTITINATANDPDGFVKQVEFFDGATSLAIDTAAPYSYSSTSFSVGSHALSAKVTDSSNAVVTSNTINITVNPAVSLAAPTIAVSASAPPPPVTPPISNALNLMTGGFGTAGNGTTDDQTAITNALAAAKSQGKALYAPGGHTYKHSAMISIDGVTLFGDGDTTIFSASTLSAGALRLTGTNPSLISVQTIYNPPPTTRASTGPEAGVFIDNASGGYTVDNVTVANAPNIGILSFRGVGTSSSHAKVNNCRVSLTKADAIHMTNGSAYVDITNCTVTNVGDDAFAVVSYLGDGVQTHDILYDGNTAVWNLGTPNDSGRGMSCVGGNNVLFNNNTVTNTNWAGVYLASENLASDSFDCYPVDTVTVQNCHIDQANKDFSAGGHAGIMTYGHPSGHGLTNLTISGNTVTNSANQGIDIRQYASGVTVSGNTITTTGTAGANQPGINVDGAAVVASNNIISDTGGEGIRVRTPATSSCQILTNDFSKINRIGSGDVIDINSGAVVSPLTITNNTYHTNPPGYTVGTFVNLHGYVGATVSGNNQV